MSSIKFHKLILLSWVQSLHTCLVQNPHGYHFSLQVLFLLLLFFFFVELFLCFAIHIIIIIIIIIIIVVVVAAIITILVKAKKQYASVTWNYVVSNT